MDRIFNKIQDSNKIFKNDTVLVYMQQVTIVPKAIETQLIGT